VRESLECHALEHSDGVWRVRLLVSPAGSVHVESAPLTLLGGEDPLPVTLARTPISRTDRFLFHKTTRRAVYEDRRREGGDTVFDVLLYNEEGELTEFTTGNLAVERERGMPWWTPPRACGLLAGTLRQELLDQGTLRERVLRRDDLARPSRLYFLNGVRGVVPVRLIQQ